MAAIDKSKIEKRAVQYIQKGAYRKAATEYEQIVAADPKDMRAQAKLLDLYLRLGKKEDALDKCRIVANFYVAQGFVPRAIAEWKKTARLDQDNPEIYKNLGELYIKQKLVGDALGVFQRAVALYRKAGKTDEAGSMLRRMEELAPKNPSIKLLLAEHDLISGNIPEFAAHLDAAIGQLKEVGRGAKLLGSLETLYKKYERPEIIRPLAELYVNMGQHEKALEFIREGLGKLPGDHGLRLDAISAHIALGNTDEARRMAHELYEESPNDIFIMEQLAHFAEQKGEIEEQAAWYQRLAHSCKEQGQEVKAGQYERKAQEILPKESEDSFSFEGGELDMVLDTLVIPEKETESPAWAAPVEEVDIADGVKEADLYLKYGLEDKARQKLLELSNISPENLEVHQKLRDLYHRQNDTGAWIREQVTIAEIFKDEGHLQEARGVYHAILEEDPGNRLAADALEKLRPTQPAPPKLATATGKGIFQEVIDEVDGLAASDRVGEAVETLLRLREQFPDSLEIANRLEKFGWQDLEDLVGGFRDSDIATQTELGELEYDIASGIAGFEDVEISELDDIVKEFKAGVSEKLDADDFETHYDLGVAYKEMGLLDEALYEFQQASRGSEKAKDAYASMAMIYRDTGQLQEARSALNLALSAATKSREDRAAVLYELGAVCEELKEYRDAFACFKQAAALSPGLRDVAERLEALKSTLAD
ncbi:tetratricopeptide repeat protein [bacterium]|nr:MAG: tetratricopeptide repeat protein [bacterium]